LTEGTISRTRFSFGFGPQGRHLAFPEVRGTLADLPNGATSVHYRCGLRFGPMLAAALPILAVGGSMVLNGAPFGVLIIVVFAGQLGIEWHRNRRITYATNATARYLCDRVDAALHQAERRNAGTAVADQPG
jgi:hypothetical protein